VLHEEPAPLLARDLLHDTQALQVIDSSRTLGKLIVVTSDADAIEKIGCV
jgi:hypothetical protein